MFLAVPASAQEGVILGTIVDGTKAALPGATVTATLIDTGRADHDGQRRARRVPAARARPGRYKLQAEFVRLLDRRHSRHRAAGRPEPHAAVRHAGGVAVRDADGHRRIAARRHQLDAGGAATSIAGRWKNCRCRAATGWSWRCRSRASPPTPSTPRPACAIAQFQLNLDGQEITQQVAGSGFGQPKFSREAIAEFQVVTNLFDITQGRSLGIQVQAISRSGTNNYDGSVYGYFRDDKWIAKDFIANRVLPYRQPADRRRDRRSDRQGQGALLPVVRARERAEHDPGVGGGAAGSVVSRSTPS